jgi:hypothetical protein
MPSAQLYFRDPDGHLLELITLLDEEPDPNFFGLSPNGRNELCQRNLRMLKSKVLEAWTVPS